MDTLGDKFNDEEEPERYGLASAAMLDIMVAVCLRLGIYQLSAADIGSILFCLFCRVDVLIKTVGEERREGFFRILMAAVERVRDNPLGVGK